MTSVCYVCGNRIRGKPVYGVGVARHPRHGPCSKAYRDHGLCKRGCPIYPCELLKTGRWSEGGLKRR
jgi:Zn-finger protein